MAEALYRLVDDEISDIVDQNASELMKKFQHGFPRGTRIEGRNHIGLANVSLPRDIEVTYPGRKIHFPQTKLNGLYAKVK